MKPIRIMMADDSPEIRNYFTNIISHEEDMELAGTASTGAEAVQLARDLRLQTDPAGASRNEDHHPDHPGGR